MNREKGFWMKTYGKSRRLAALPVGCPAAWSPDNRKQDFDTTASANSSNPSVCLDPTETSKKKKSTVGSGRVRAAKKKALVSKLWLTPARRGNRVSRQEGLLESKVQQASETSSSNSNMSASCLEVEPKETSKRKRSNSISSRRVRTAKRQDRVSSKENCEPSKEPARRGNRVSRQEGLLKSKVQQASETSSSNSTMSASCLEVEPKETSKRKRSNAVGSRRVRTAKRQDGVSSKEKRPPSDSSIPQTNKPASVAPPPPGRFVTQRRGAATKACSIVLHNLDSSDEFVLPDLPRQRKARLMIFSFESSVNDTVKSSTIGEAEDQTLGPYTRKPLFCSTPSLHPVGKRPGVSAASPPVSPLDLCPSPEELVPSGDPFSPPISAPLGEPGSGCKLLPPLSTEAPHIEKTSSVILFSDGSDHNSVSTLSHHTQKSDDGDKFVAVPEGSKCLIDALVNVCLNKRCYVQLERVDKQTVIPLHPQTPFSSRVGYSSSALCPQTIEDPQMVESGLTAKHSDWLCPGPPCHLTDYSASLIDGRSVYPSESLTATLNLFLSANSSQSVSQCDSSEHKPSVTDVHISSLAHSVETNQSVDSVQSTRQVDDSIECVTDACPVEDSAYQQQLCKQRPKEKAAIVSTLEKDCLAKKCTVQLKRLSSTQWAGAQQLGEGTRLASTDDPSSHSFGTAWSGNECAAQSNHSENTGQPKRHSVHSEHSAGANGATDSEDATSNVKEVVENPNECRRRPKKMVSRAAKEKRRSVSRDRPGTTRKAFVSGLSVSRWRDKGNASAHRFQNQHARRGGSKAGGDCSITELLSGQHNEPKVVDKGLLQDDCVSSPTSRQDLSSLLAHLTPQTQTWSRLKASLSVYRRFTVGITPGTLRTSLLESPGRAGLVDASMDLFDVPVKTPLSKRLPSQLHNGSAFLNVSEDAEYDLSDAEKVYAECNQQGALCWEECILPERLEQCKKIGEGTFGEVFSTINASGDTVALKIIPIEGNEKVNGEEQKTFGNILHEIIISKELSSLKAKQHNQTYGFIGLHGLHCVKGSYPAVMLKAWDAFDHQKGSENDRPDFFEEEQLFLILEFEFGGSDLENSNGKLSSLMVAKTILHQVTAALAVAEQELCFEHRDLHWGNILVKTTKEKSASFSLNGKKCSLDTKGVLVRIIDYSLSRLEIDGLTVACDISEDEELFMGQGDYQFDIYRLMREENSNEWNDYQPHSNVLWLHYLCSKLLSMKYRGAGGRAKATREELTRIHDNLLQYRSATEALQSGLF